MKKIFLLIPALVLSLMVNADTWNIAPGTSLAYTVSDATAGDVIVMADGLYPGEDQIHLTKDITIKAAEGANPVVQTTYYCDLMSGAKVHIEGITFDGSTTSQQCIRVYDATAGKELHLNNCEFKNYPKDVISGDKGEYTLDSCIVNNCYFHDNNYSPIYFNKSSVAGKQTIYGLIVKNSTFANNDPSKEYRSVIDVQTYNRESSNDIEILVDHCTFYNNTTLNYDYSAIRTRIAPRTTVSNCIFAHPSAIEFYATNVWEGTVTNCLAYNLNKGYMSGPTLTNTNIGAPLFNDLAHNKYTYDGDWETPSISPARSAATDGSDLGDPRWYSAETLPSVDFASDYDLLGAKALLTGDVELNESQHIKYIGSSTPGIVTWKLHATRPCALSGVIDMESGNTSGCTLKLIAFDADGNKVDSLVAPYTDKDLDVTISGCMSLPAEGDYTLKLYNGTGWSSSKIEKITLSYIGGAVQNMPGTTDINEAWFSADGTRAGGVIDFPDGKIQDNWVKWNVAFASAANFNVIVKLNSNNCKNYTVSLLDANGDDVVTPLSKNDCDTKGSDIALEMGAMTVPAGNYVLQVVNGTKDSDAELISVQFVPAGGGLVDIPKDNIPFSEAILSGRAFIDGNGEIRFTTDAEHSHVTEESVKWRVNVSKEGNYKFTTSVNSTNGHSYLVSVYNADETVLKGSVAQSGDDIWGIAKTFSTDNIYLAEGEYRLIIQNTTPNSNGRIVSISASYEGGAIVNVPNNAIPFADAILNGGATRNLVNDPHEIHFGSVSANAQWNVHATAGLYTFTFDVVGTNYGIYKLDILDGSETIFTQEKGQDKVGQVTISNAFIPADGDYVLQLANINSGADGYLTSLAATAATDVFVLDENTEDDGSIAAAAGNSYTFLLKRSFEADRYYTICIPVSSWNSELKLAFGNDYELWQMTSATQSGDEINLNFDKCNDDGFEAGIPYIIKPSVDVQNPIFHNSKTIYNATWNNTQEFTVADFIGTFYKGKIDAGVNNLYLQNNDLYYSQSNDTPIKGTRAWIRIKPAGGSAGVRARIVLGGQSATAIDLVNGELVNGTVKTIEDGQLVIIRDGVRYNVMGIRLQ